MMSFRILVCIASVVVSTWAAIPYTDVKINIFDSHPRDFEQRVLHLMNTTHRFYAEHNVSSIFDILAEHTPYVGELGDPTAK